jgi:hypothetical protein
LYVQAYYGKKVFFRGQLPKRKRKIVDKKVLKQKKGTKKRKRSEKRHLCKKSYALKMFAVNAAGIRCKLKSFNQIIESLKPQIWMVEETKLNQMKSLNVKPQIIKKIRLPGRWPGQGVNTCNRR